MAERKKRNRITVIKRKDGTECRDENGIANEIANYFENLFITSSPQDRQELLDKVPRTISESMSRSLTKPIADLEIKQALFSMHPNKAPGPNGITLSFIKSFGIS